MVPKILALLLLVVLASAAPRSQSRSQSDQQSGSTTHAPKQHHQKAAVANDAVQGQQAQSASAHHGKGAHNVSSRAVPAHQKDVATNTSQPIVSSCQKNRNNTAAALLGAVRQGDASKNAAQAKQVVAKENHVKSAGRAAEQGQSNTSTARPAHAGKHHQPAGSRSPKKA